MTQWYVKELSKLTNISVQTLHYYDRINLLKPSVRLTNGYRVYSEKDLLKLQQIIALKYFGFELAQIKTLLEAEVDMLEHFNVQSQCLEEKAKTLLEASQTLKQVIHECNGDKSIPWTSLIKLIEVYRMTQQLEKTWAGKIFNSQELKEYANFEQELKTRFSEKELQHLNQQWADLLKDVEANLQKEPTSEFGITLGKRCMDWVNKVYGKDHVALRNAIWDKGFKESIINEADAPSPACFTWLDKAITAYYRNRVSNVLEQINRQPHQSVLDEWKALLMDMHGKEEDQKNAFLQALMNDENLKSSVKDWLRQHSV